MISLYVKSKKQNETEICSQRQRRDWWLPQGKRERDGEIGEGKKLVRMLTS